MIRTELHDDRCPTCDARLSAADYLNRHEVVFATGEYRGEPGMVIVCECPCGLTSVIPLSVSPRRRVAA